LSKFKKFNKIFILIQYYSVVMRTIGGPLYIVAVSPEASTL